MRIKMVLLLDYFNILIRLNRSENGIETDKILPDVYCFQYDTIPIIIKELYK